MSQAEVSSPITNSLPIPPNQSEACWHILPTIHCTLGGVAPGPWFRWVVSSPIHYTSDVSVANSGFFLQSWTWAQDLQAPRVQPNHCCQPKSLLFCPLKPNEKYTEFGGNRKVAFILNWWRGHPSRLMSQELCSPSMRSLGAYIRQVRSWWWGWFLPLALFQRQS